MTSKEARDEGYREALAGKPSHIAPIGLHHRQWMSGWIDGHVERNRQRRLVVESRDFGLGQTRENT